MYFANPVVLFGAGMLLLALAMLAWRILSKSDELRHAADALMRVSLTWCAVMLVMGLIMGLNHASAHPKCQQLKASGGDIKGCAYFFEHYGE